MPQLNPLPWFTIFFVTWLVFIIVSPIKISKYININDLSKKHIINSNKPWLWPWP